MAMNTTQNTSGASNGLLVILAVAFIGLAAVGAVYLMQDHRTPVERLGDAADALPQGLGKATNKLGDQPPAKNVERNLGDAAKKVN